MGYELSNEVKTKDVVKAIDMAIGQRRNHTTCIHHSDRGLQHCSSLYQERLKSGNMVASMTDGWLRLLPKRPGGKINGILKQELLLEACQNITELEKLVSEPVAIYNNNMRPHLSL